MNKYSLGYGGLRQCTARRMHKPFRHKYFSLIELLTVISIITILASLLLPALGKARGKARQIQCASNFKQFGIASAEYYNDYNSSFAYYAYRFTAEDGTTVSATWRSVLLPYVNDKPKITHIGTVANPSVTPTLRSKYACPEVNENYKADTRFNYACTIGASLYGGDYSDNMFKTLRNNSFKYPSRLLFLADAFGMNISSDTVTESAGELRLWHSKGANILYRDLHVNLRLRGSFTEGVKTPFWNPFPTTLSD